MKDEDIAPNTYLLLIKSVWVESCTNTHYTILQQYSIPTGSAVCIWHNILVFHFTSYSIYYYFMATTQGSYTNYIFFRSDFRVTRPGDWEISGYRYPEIDRPPGITIPGNQGFSGIITWKFFWNFLVGWFPGYDAWKLLISVFWYLEMLISGLW